MFAAEIWHWWIGLVLTLASIGAVVMVIVGYMKKVVQPQYPSRRQRS
jgi:formate-dependent nitrite reductase membrane component NrfD